LLGDAETRLWSGNKSKTEPDMNIEKLNIMELCVQEKQKKDKGLFEDH